MNLQFERNRRGLSISDMVQITLKDQRDIRHAESGKSKKLARKLETLYRSVPIPCTFAQAFEAWINIA